MTTEDKLIILRDRWKKEPHNRKIIEAQAGLLKLGIKYGRMEDQKLEEEVSRIKQALS